MHVPLSKTPTDGSRKLSLPRLARSLAITYFARAGPRHRLEVPVEPELAPAVWVPFQLSNVLLYRLHSDLFHAFKLILGTFKDISAT